MLKLFFFILLAYIIGSFSSAIILCRLQGLPDPRTEGSRNPGATNALRIGGKKLAAWVAIGDALKGFIPVLIAKICGLESALLSIVALSGVVGHVFPLFFGFKGGKGIATAFGATLAISFSLGFVLALTWLIVVYFFRYSSLAGIAAAILMPIYSYYLVSPASSLPLILLSLLIIWRHFENIARLMQGTEKKTRL
jgi:glycerol-3-phosphate acyltransferase PlsY